MDVRLPRGQPALVAAVNATALISRDGGPFEEPAQPVESRAYGITFFRLTAEEMEAEYIVIPATPLVTIRTTGEPHPKGNQRQKISQYPKSRV